MSQNDRTITVGTVTFGRSQPMSLIAGPCAMEGRDHALTISGALKRITDRLGMGLVYKTSFDKANRTSLSGFRGIGIEEGLEILAAVKRENGIPVLTDIHEPAQCAKVAEVADILQIPAFLCRQTDLLVAAAATGRVVNIKKGQFLAPWDMPHVTKKVSDNGNDRILLTERGASFGYNTLVADMRSLEIMARSGYPVIFDATHSVQQPGGLGGSSGGQREFVPVLARAAVAAGVAGIFVECHDDPDNAPSDGPNMVPIDRMEGLLQRLQAIDQVVKQS